MAGLRVERASLCAGFSGVRFGLCSRVRDGSRLVLVKACVGLGELWASGGGLKWA